MLQLSPNFTEKYGRVENLDNSGVKTRTINKNALLFAVDLVIIQDREHDLHRSLY